MNNYNIAQFILCYDKRLEMYLKIGFIHYFRISDLNAIESADLHELVFKIIQQVRNDSEIIPFISYL